MSGGAELARGYWADVVSPLVRARWPRLPLAAARLRAGSEVLGFDDGTSRDHDWGPRLTLCTDEGVGVHGELECHLERHLPATYRGLPTWFTVTGDPRVRHRGLHERERGPCTD